MQIMLYLENSCFITRKHFALSGTGRYYVLSTTHLSSPLSLNKLDLVSQHICAFVNAEFNLSEKQAEALLDINLRRLTHLEVNL